MNLPPQAAARPAQVEPLQPTAPAQAGVRRLFEEVFGSAITPEHWRWKYRGPPGAVALHRVLVGPEGPDRPWGHVGCLVLPGQFDAASAHVAHLTDVMVHPQYRSGLESVSPYAILMRAIAADLHALAGVGQPLLAFGFPGLVPSRLGTRMRLYRPLYRVHRYRHEVPEGGGHSRLRLQAWPLDSEFPDGLRWVDSLWRQLGDQQPQPGPLKGAAYLAWRYGGHPLRPYRFWRVRSPWLQTLGWVVTRQAPDPVIIDSVLPVGLSSGPGWAGVVASLGRASGQRVWLSWRPTGVPGESTEPTLIEAGEFRWAELSGLPSSPWPSRPVPGRPGHAGAPLFQPGDTDVF